MFGFSSNHSKILGMSIAALLIAGLPVRAEDVTESQILKALSAPSTMPLAAPRTRGLSLGQPARPDAATATASANPDEAFIDSLRNRNSRSLSVGDREKLVAVAANKPAIDLEMEFDYNSDTLRGPALETANKLGKALSSPELRGQTFAITGHTDAKGTDQVNQGLSERRAEAVKSFLVSRYGIPASNLITAGYGKARLKNASAPFAKENRRVQAVNMLQVKTAGR
ncbi:Peptidoglycan-associated lipoprotein [Methylobacterium iners]|uniref:Peptidoglycan-associated lipoprotein n=2 Tax=Methylobacterium iners TaxID=418707 RepID=A0ABQ4S1D8_9HYPH|nr:Peptidoglycan-associated lipoprotein [Methylobacterium iners]